MCTQIQLGSFYDHPLPCCRIFVIEKKKKYSDSIAFGGSQDDVTVKKTRLCGNYNSRKSAEVT